MVRKRQNRKQIKHSDIILYSIVGILLIVTIVIGYKWYSTYYGSSYQKAIESELEDKCKTPSGYTDGDWKDHMSHHPDRYKECL